MWQLFSPSHRISYGESWENTLVCSPILYPWNCAFLTRNRSAVGFTITFLRSVISRCESNESESGVKLLRKTKLSPQRNTSLLGVRNTFLLGACYKQKTTVIGFFLYTWGRYLTLFNFACDLISHFSERFLVSCSCFDTHPPITFD